MSASPMRASLKNWNIGFIGLGLMGKPMCLNLHRHGANLSIYNRTAAVSRALQQDRVVACETPREVAAAASVIILMVADTAAVEGVLLGDDGVIEGLRSGSTVIDMGTTAVSATRRFASEVAARGGDYLDAPVSGGEIGAVDGKLSIMVGGAAPSVARAQPVFDVLGKKVVHIGEVGTGQVTKAANQVIVGLNIGAVAEALTLAKHAGADMTRVREALLGGFAASRVLEVHGQRIIDGNFEPGGKILTQHKDLSQAIDLAAEFGLELPATELTRKLYQRLIDEGDGELDHSALVRALDR